MEDTYRFREIVKNDLMDKLYRAQFNYWNKKLKDLCKKNANFHGRYGEKYMIYFNNRKWEPSALNWLERPVYDNYYCLAIHPDHPEIRKDMEAIAEEVTEILDEKYEADRFLAGLFLFPAPAQIFNKILGDTLYNACRTELEKHCHKFSNESWDNNSKASLSDYANANTYIVEAMNQRIMLNLITLDGSHVI